VPLGFIIMALPISVAGVGIGQAAFFFLFKAYTGHESQIGPNGITAYQLLQLALGLIGAVMYLQRRKALNPVAVAAKEMG
jgi:glycosyltransferase 2 family protein